MSGTVVHHFRGIQLALQLLRLACWSPVHLADIGAARNVQQRLDFAGAEGARRGFGAHDKHTL